MLCPRSTVFDAIAHPVRRRILEEMIQDPSPKSITDLSEQVEVSRSTASRHLDILRRSGLVTAIRDRQATLHGICVEEMKPVTDWLWSFFDEPDPAN